MKTVSAIDGDGQQDVACVMRVEFERLEPHGIQPCESQSRATRPRTRAARTGLAVERAIQYIGRHLADPIRLSHLCRHSGAQARSLEYAFRAVLGVSPIAYVRTTRLQRARRLLRSAAVRTRSISEIALDCGFSHLSQFAVDYKRMFGESPSITFRRTRADVTTEHFGRRSRTSTLR
jgi:transcriptional regulator GlxA family with amidase domain